MIGQVTTRALTLVDGPSLLLVEYFVVTDFRLARADRKSFALLGVFVGKVFERKRFMLFRTGMGKVKKESCLGFEEFAYL